MKHPETERNILDPNLRLYAYKVPGGWLYVCDGSMVFVPETKNYDAFKKAMAEDFK